MMEDQIEQSSPAIETGQLAETKQVLIKALQEPDPAYNFSNNQALRESWIDTSIARLSNVSPEGQETERVVAFADATLASQENRAFAAAYFDHMGSSLKIEQLKDIVSGKIKVGKVTEANISSARDKRIVWVTGEDGENKYLAMNTKIDGVTIMLDMHQIGIGPETTGFLHPILHVSK